MEREFQAEVEALSRAQHKNLVSLQGYCRHGSDRLLIYSYMENGSWDYWLHESAVGLLATGEGRELAGAFATVKLCQFQRLFLFFASASISVGMPSAEKKRQNASWNGSPVGEHKLNKNNHIFKYLALIIGIALPLEMLKGLINQPYQIFRIYFPSPSLSLPQHPPA